MHFQNSNKYLYKFESDRKARRKIVDIVMSVITKLPKLEHFEIDCGDCTFDMDLVDQIFASVAEHGKKLKYLRLRGNFKKLENSLLNQINECLPQLRYNLKNWPIH